MIVNLLMKDGLSFITLPEKVKGKYTLAAKDPDGRLRDIIGVEAEDGKWILKSGKTAWVLDAEGKRAEKTELCPMSLHSLEMAESGDRASVFAERISQDRQRLSKVPVAGPCELSIGRSGRHEISYDNKYISESDGRGHARLTYDGNAWAIKDLGSTNGVYVNGARAVSQKLGFGDLIYVMGLRIVVGKSFFAVNDPDGKVSLRSETFKAYAARPGAEAEAEASRNAPPEEESHAAPPEEESHDAPPEDTSRDAPPEEYFYRSPRFRRDFKKAEITIDPPPAPERTERLPMALLLGPSLTMGLASLSMGVLTFTNIVASGGDVRQAMPTLFMSVSMLLGTLLWPPLTKRSEKKARAAKEKKRQDEYLAYLDGVRDEIRRKCREQSEILSENITALDDCISRVTERKRTLWERISGQDDFLLLRLGRGTMPLDAEIAYPEKRFTLESDSLMDAVLSLGSEEKLLKDVPIGVSLAENRILGIVGPRSVALGLIRSLLIQTVALHSYDELKLAFIIDGCEAGQWAFARLLPHAWDNDKSTRYFASTADETKDLSAILEKTALSKRMGARQESGGFSPYYLIIAGSRELALKCEALERLLESEGSYGFSVITLYDDIQNIPKETQCVIDLDGSMGRIYDKDDLTGKAQTFMPDTATLAVMEAVSQRVANIALDVSERRFALPGMLTFLEMFGVSKIEHLNPLARWKESNPSLTLQTPLGVDVFGETFMLDLHEGFHGPHGLIAGTTGSGKSELIMTYILSLAVNFHPDEAAFLLIDYKGGGLTGAFEFESEGRAIRLPHLAGTITNLDGAAIKRAMVAIESESKRRQGVFNEAKNASGEGTMDIYKYQRLRREGIVGEPMPHLFIITDEFAELKSQQPEFMDRLISTARVGRSLGIHLILATQKPAGVVDDQIWSNSRFRVCLKVQEKADSMDMLKRPDAAEITATGRFYLQVGFNEIFALGQSAWSGAEYVPTDAVEKKVDSTVRVVDALGRSLREVKPVRKTDPGAKRPKQLVALVRYLSELASEEGITVRNLWKEPIPEYIYVDELERKYAYRPASFTLDPLIGELDDPYNQRQTALTLPLSSEGNCVVYGAAGNGKTTLLTTLLYSLVKHHDAQEVNIYVLDFGAETLTSFESAPQVGGVLLGHESERMGNLFMMLLRQFDMRRRLFSQYGGDLQGYNKRSGRTMPCIIVAINNYAAFSEQYGDHEDTFALLSRDGLKYGIVFVVAANNTMAIRWRIQQNFKQILTMQQNDESAYPVILGKTGGIIPSSYKGRGLVSLDKVYEFQTAYATREEDIIAYARRFSEARREGAGCFAMPVPMMPDRVTADTFSRGELSLRALPVGISRETLEPAPYDFTVKAICPVLSNELATAAGVAEGLCGLMSAICEVTVFDAALAFSAEYGADGNGAGGKLAQGNHVGAVPPRGMYVRDGFDEAFAEEFKDFVERHDTYKRARRLGEKLPEPREKAMAIIGLSRLLEALSEENAGNLKEMLKRAEPAFGVAFILADSLQSFKAMWDHEWYKTHVPGVGGIWAGDGFSIQAIFDPARKPYDNISDEYGYVYQKGQLTLAKLISASGADMEVNRR